MEEKIRELAKQALAAREKSYAPYSKFHVGAALLTKDGRIIQGCNIENAAYGPTNCAERTAFFKSISEGIYGFQAIAIAGGPEEGPLQYCAPCGVCRQVMAEFCEGDFKIYLVKSADDRKEYTLEELLPERFGPENLQ